MLDRLLDHKADEHFFEEVHAPIFYLCRELLRRNIEKVSQLLGVVEPEKVRKSSRHEHLERDEIALAKLVMKEGEKPGKFLLPHGIILLEFGPYRIFMEGNPEGIQNQRPLGIMELSVSNLHSMPQPPIDGPLRRRLGRFPLRYIWERLPGLPHRQQGPQGLALLVLPRYGTDVAQIQAQPGQLVFRRGHLAVANEDRVLQRQEVRQPDMCAEGRKLGGVCRAISGAAMQHVKPHRQAPIASSQGEEL